MKSKLFKKKYDFDLEEFDRLLELIQTKFGISLYRHTFLKKVNYVIELSNYYRKWFVRSNPRAVLIADYYNSNGFAVSLACRSIGIPSVDIQHGVAGEFNPAYGNWTNLPESGWEMLPTFFWTWTDEDSVSVKKWATDPFHASFTGGNLWVSAWKNKEIALGMDRIKLDQLKERSLGKKIALFTPNALADFKPWILKILTETSDQFVWWIRLHPSMYADTGKIMQLLTEAKCRFELDDPTILPLMALLLEVDINVTSSSATVMDCELMGIRSLITHSSGIELFTDQVKKGVALQTTEPSSLLKELGSIKNKVKPMAVPMPLEMINKFLSVLLDSSR